MHNAVAHHPLTKAQPSACSPWRTFPLVYKLSMTPYGMEYPFGQLGSAVPAVSLPSSCTPTCQVMLEAEKSLPQSKHCSATTATSLLSI